MNQRKMIFLVQKSRIISKGDKLRGEEIDHCLKT